jgi:MoaA/NifB/PqqE/SkfB family radical SAM enzyme
LDYVSSSVPAICAGSDVQEKEIRVMRMDYWDLAGKYFHSKTPVCLVYAVTSRCNSRCKTCFYHQKLNKPNVRELSLPELDRVSRGFRSIMELVLTGGEPFMRDDLSGVCEVFYNNAHVRAVSVSTNAFFSEQITRQVQRVMSRCPHMLLSVELSLDDIGERHDAIRGLSGSFDRLLKTHAELVRIRDHFPNLRVKVNTTVCADNEERIDEVIRFVERNLEVNDHSISPIGGDPRERSVRNISWARYMRMAGGMIGRARARAPTLLEKLFFALREKVLEEMSRVVSGNRLSSPCVAARRILFMDEQGDVYPCVLRQERLGAMRDMGYDIRKILWAAKGTVAPDMAVEPCASCIWDCGIFYNILYDPLKYPGIVQKMLIGTRS